MSQRSTIIQQQMQQHQHNRPPTDTLLTSPSLPPQASKTLTTTTTNLSTSLILNSPNAAADSSPKHLNKTLGTETTTTITEISSPTPPPCGYPRLKSSKMPLEILFDQFDTSLYLNQIGSYNPYKIFRFKNILTLGDFCSLTNTAINSLPFKTPKMENYLSLLRSFEEKCADKIKKYDPPSLVADLNTPQPPQPVKTILKIVSEATNKLGSMEEEMEKLESSSSNLDTSIECESFTENQTASGEENVISEEVKFVEVATRNKNDSIEDLLNKSSHDNNTSDMDVSSSMDKSETAETTTATTTTTTTTTDKSVELKEKFNELKLFFTSSVRLEELSMDELFKLSESIDVQKHEFDNYFYNLQASIRKLIKSKTSN
jgi:hypothetical protein